MKKYQPYIDAWGEARVDQNAVLKTLNLYNLLISKH